MVIFLEYIPWLSDDFKAELSIEDEGFSILTATI